MNSEIFHLPLTALAPGEPETAPAPAVGLPQSYGRDRLAALPRDPRCIWLYWELAGASGEAELRLFYAETRHPAVKAACRVENASHYLEVPVSGRSYYAELWTLDAGGRWRSRLRSNVVCVPFGYPADEPGARWQAAGGPASAVSSRR